MLFDVLVVQHVLRGDCAHPPTASHAEGQTRQGKTPPIHFFVQPWTRRLIRSHRGNSLVEQSIVGPLFLSGLSSSSGSPSLVDLGLVCQLHLDSIAFCMRQTFLVGRPCRPVHQRSCKSPLDTALSQSTGRLRVKRRLERFIA